MSFESRFWRNRIQLLSLVGNIGSGDEKQFPPRPEPLSSNRWQTNGYPVEEILSEVRGQGNRLKIAQEYGLSVPHLDRMKRELGGVKCATPRDLVLGVLYNLWEEQPDIKRGGMTVDEVRNKVGEKFKVKLPSPPTVYRAQNHLDYLLNLGLVRHPLSSTLPKVQGSSLEPHISGSSPARNTPKYQVQRQSVEPSKVDWPKNLRESVNQQLVGLREQLHSRVQCIYQSLGSLMF